MIPEAGQKFGPYEILGKLGRGGMGHVFRAWDQRLHREVALKLPHQDDTMPRIRERFLQEARAASAMNHPNICTIFDIGDQNGEPYLVMEVLEGQTLKDRILHGVLSPEEIVRYAGDVADAMATAHARGIVHRDLKPANIFLVAMPDGRSQAKVLDFGLASIGPNNIADMDDRGGRQSRSLDLTSNGSAVGTLAYMSPEQARGELLDARSDLFSLGIVMYEMATRQLPFKGATSALTFVELFQHNPEPVRHWNESVPSELEHVISTLLSKDPDTRFQSAKELRDALAKISQKLAKGSWLSRGSAAAVPLVPAPDPVARLRPARRSRSDDDHDSSGQRTAISRLFSRTSSSNNRAVRSMRASGMSPAAIANRQTTTQLTTTSHGSRVDSSEMHLRLSSLNSATTTSPPSVHFVSAANAGRLVELGEAEPTRIRSQSAAALFEQELEGAALRSNHAEATSQAAAVPALLRQVHPATKVLIAAAAIVVLAGGALLLARSGIFRPLVLGPNDRLLLTVIQNRTGDTALEGSVAQGMEIALRQSDSLRLLGAEAYRAGVRQLETEGGNSGDSTSWQRVAQKLGAKAYLYGEITGPNAPFTIHLDLLDADSNDKMVTLEEIATDRTQIPAAIGRLARAVRTELGEGRSSGSVPFTVDATANLDALHAFALGESSAHSGDSIDAIAHYQKAVRLDPMFVQAWMRLASVYRSEKAELAAADAANHAYKAATHTDEKTRLLAQFSYEMNTTGDLVAATATIQHLVALHPTDVDASNGLAELLRLQGHLPEALQTAQQAIQDNPFDGESYTQAYLAMAGMNRDDSALKAQARRLGVTPSPSGQSLEENAANPDNTSPTAANTSPLTPSPSQQPIPLAKSR